MSLGLTIKVWQWISNNKDKPDPLLPYLEIAAQAAPYIDINEGITPEIIMEFALKLADLRRELDEKPMNPPQERGEPDGR